MKLWNQMQEHLSNGTYELTYGGIDPVIVAEMAKYQQVRLHLLSGNISEACC